MVIGKYNQTGGSNDTTLMGRPSEIWVDPTDNEVFVADGYGNRRVIVFDGATGKYLRHWGAYGKRPEDPPPNSGSSGSGGASARSSDTVPAAPPPQLRVPHGITGSRDGTDLRRGSREQPDPGVSPGRASSSGRRSCGRTAEREEQATWAPKRPCGTEAAFSVAFSHDAPQTLRLRRRRRHARHHAPAPERPRGRGRVRGTGRGARSARPPPQSHGGSLREHLRGRGRRARGEGSALGRRWCPPGTGRRSSVSRGHR